MVAGSTITPSLPAMIRGWLVLQLYMSIAAGETNSLLRGTKGRIVAEGTRRAAAMMPVLEHLGGAQAVGMHRACLKPALGILPYVWLMQLPCPFPSYWGATGAGQGAAACRVDTGATAGPASRHCSNRAAALQHEASRR